VAPTYLSGKTVGKSKKKRLTFVAAQDLCREDLEAKKKHLTYWLGVTSQPLGNEERLLGAPKRQFSSKGARKRDGDPTREGGQSGDQAPRAD